MGLRSRTSYFSLRQLLLGAIGLLAIVLGLLTAASGGTLAASNQAPSLAPCPSWDIMSTPNSPGGGNVLLGISVAAPNEVWAVGYSYTTDAFEPLAMRWDGTSWKIVPGPTPGPAGTNYFQDVVAFSATDVWASVSAGPNDKPIPNLVHWDGTRWTVAQLPAIDESGADFYAISGSGPNDVWAVGSVGCSQCKTERSIALHYNGVDWQVKPLSSSALADAYYGVSAFAPDYAWFAGYQYDEHRAVQPFVSYWNGSAMKEVEVLDEGGNSLYLHDITVIASNDVWAVGQAGTRNAQGYILHGSQVGFGKIAVPAVSAEGSILLSVDGSAWNDIWASGYFLASGQRRAWLLHYDGTSWTPAQFPDPGDGSSFYDVEVGANKDAYAAGFTALGISLVENYTDRCASPPATATNTPAPPTATPTPVAVVPIPGSNSRVFPETGRNVGGLFLDYWEQNGGLAQQGYPISEPAGEVSPLDKKPYTVQYFERAVFEYHPENQAPYNVLLSQLGTFQYKKKYPTGAPGQTANTDAGSVLFAETGHRVGGKFLEYWQKNGGLAQQGYPISDEFQEKSDLDGKTYTVQYFERAVFELHPENQAPYDVLLSQLGAFRYKDLYGPKAASTP